MHSSETGNDPSPQRYRGGDYSDSRSHHSTPRFNMKGSSQTDRIVFFAVAIPRSARRPNRMRRFGGSPWVTLMNVNSADAAEEGGTAGCHGDRLGLLILRLGSFFCFTGWSWAHLYWEGPYGILLWHDSTFELAARLGISWDEFVGSGAGDGLVQQWVGRVGWLYLLCAVLSITVGRRSWIQLAILAIVGSGLLGLLSYAKYVGSQYQLPMLVEHGGQILMPVLLVMAVAIGVRHRLTVAAAMVAVVMTFAGHGSYALGLWPTPANFYAMISVCLHVEYETARIILRTAGIFDVLVCIGIFLPVLQRAAVVYAACWGFLTALARPVAGMSWSLNYFGADQFLHEAVLRAPHFLIPLYLLVVWRKPKFNSTNS